MRPSASSKIRSALTLSASLSASASVSSGATPSRTSSPGPIAATSRPSTETDARLTRWTSALIDRAAATRLRGQPLPVDAVVVALGAQIGRDRQVAPRPVALAGQGQRPAEAEVGEVVDRIALHDGLELARRLRRTAGCGSRRGRAPRESSSSRAPSGRPWRAAPWPARSRRTRAATCPSDRGRRESRPLASAIGPSVGTASGRSRPQRRSALPAAAARESPPPGRGSRRRPPPWGPAGPAARRRAPRSPPR